MKTKSEINDPIRNIQIQDGFWGPIIQRSFTSTLPHVFNQLKENGYIPNLEIAAGKCDCEYKGGSDRDSDVFKTMEGAAYCYSLSGDDKIDAELDKLIELISEIQEPDGYLQSYISSQAPEKRYKDLARSHELYCAGHFIEAAVAHFESTGKSSMLDIAVRLVEHLNATFGPGKMETAPGHQGIEMALIRLFNVTGDPSHLKLGKYYVDMRGDSERIEKEYGGLLIIENDRTPGRNRPPEYRQDHLPVKEQREATGHAVRAGYLYSAIADLAIECDEPGYIEAAEAIWSNIADKKLYISGGVGTHQYHDEGYGDDYLLPNDTGYCETCGGIAFMLFSHRMGLLTGDAKYADMVEKIFLNHFLSSQDISGCNTFYRNPMTSDGTRKRHPWNSPACCPTNIVRITPQFPRFTYAISENRVYIDQFANGTADLNLETGKIQIVQETEYPRDGKIDLTINPEMPMHFELCIRIPGWTDGKPVPGDLYTTVGESIATAISVNGESIDVSERKKGYCVINRKWKKGDKVEIDFPMPVQRVYAHPSVEADKGRVALMRGPVLYCLEETDMGMDSEEFRLSKDLELISEYNPECLGGLTIVRDKENSFSAIPFSFWNNREAGKMLVWIQE